MAEFEFGGEIVWCPTPAYTSGSHLERFMQQHGLWDWHDLHRRSVEDVAWFTDAMLRYLDVQFYRPYDEVVDLSAGKAWPVWCVGGKMNIVHNCLDKWIGTPQQNVAALRYESEEGSTRVLTYGDLYREVNRVAAIAEATVLNAFLERLPNWQWRDKVHVSYPHGQDIVFVPSPLAAIRSASFDYRVERRVFAS